MEYVIVAIIGLLFLAGLVFIGLGHKGWNAGTITAAVLVILSSLGYLTLVSMVGERERAWRGRVNTLRAEVAKTRDGLVLEPDGTTRPVGPCGVGSLQNCSVADLIELQQRWMRQRDRVNSWRGVWWRHAKFDPPKKGQPGTVEITTNEKPSINEGAAIYIFDDRAPDQQGAGASPEQQDAGVTPEPLGMFVGSFRVTGIDGRRLTIEAVVEPDEDDAKRWALPHNDVVVLESLPIDRWIAFHKTEPKPEDTGRLQSMKQGSDSISPGVLDENALKNLNHHEEELENLTQPESAEPFLQAEAIASGSVMAALENSAEPPPGVGWAELTFQNDHTFVWPDGTRTQFRQGELVPAFPAGQLPQLLAGDAPVSFRWVIPPGLYWADVEFTEAFTYERQPASGNPDPLVFEAGSTAELDLSFAEQLASEGKVTIRRRFFRRPLTDPQTELLGSDSITERVGNQKPVTRFENLQALGLYRIYRDLQRTLANSKARTEALQQGCADAKKQLQQLQDTTDRLEKDQAGWQRDLEVAADVEASVKDRSQKIDQELRATQEAIVQLARQLRQMTASVTAEIDRRAPPPGVLEPPPARGASLR